MPIQTPTTIRVGGVPEHFNSPWHIAIEKGLFADAGLDVQWTTIDTGTGAMCKALANDEIDVALALTEGVTADIAKGGEHKILGAYIASSLTWGVHVASGSKFDSVESLRGAKFGISRYGSGSHLMAYVQALSLGWEPQTKDLTFEIVGNLDGAKAAFAAGTADAFMWEKFTTKSIVDSGEWRRVGEFETPWPCFVATAADRFMADHSDAVATMLEIVRSAADEFKAGGDASVQYASDKYGLLLEDAQAWFSHCEWHAKPSIQEAVLTKVLKSLLAVGVISAAQAAAATPANLVSSISTVECDMPDVMYNWRVAGLLNALAAKGKAEGPLEISDLISLGHLDQYHYLGTEACDHAASTLGLCEGRRVLDVGSGIGGPARYLSATTGCSVVGVELQQDLVTTSQALTARVEALNGKVDFVCGDCTSMDLGSEYDHFISLLVFLHIPGRSRLFQACHDSLKPGGTFLIEDFYCNNPFTDEEKRQLREDVSANSVVSLSEYRAELEAAGFVDIVFEILSPVWQQWTKARHLGFVASKEQAIETHGQELFDSRARFYGVIDSLFAGGNLGGVKITGRRPGLLERQLSIGRVASSEKKSTASVLETGEQMEDVVQSSVVQAEATFGVVQPAFPAGPFHDSLQYHFFCGPVCLAGRVFYSTTLRHHSVWMHDERTGVTKELGSSSTPMDQIENEASPLCALSGEALVIEDGDGVGSFSVVGTDISVAFEWESKNVFSWEVGDPASCATKIDAAVIHRPRMKASLSIAGETFIGDGYSKRYYGPEYGPCWGYRFIVGFASPDGYQAQAEDVFSVWMADATFGDNKYNYFKVLTDDGKFNQAAKQDTWQQADAGYAIVDGNRWAVEVETLGEWWETMLENDAMKSNMQQRFCRLRFTYNGQVLHGRAINERCYGTVD